MILEKLFTPLGQTLVAVLGLFGVRLGFVLQPLHKELFVLLQHQVLPEDNVGLAFGGEPLAEHLANASQVGAGLFAHRLRDEALVLLRGGHNVAGTNEGER
ncbi:hypothetical protein TYRP_003513 [Tyrophagus putrescentiae]|nr:hypothetical protein TYRP_003513 [Tyrophagus putrescentiae]